MTQDIVPMSDMKEKDKKTKNVWKNRKNPERCHVYGEESVCVKKRKKHEIVQRQIIHG